MYRLFIIVILCASALADIGLVIPHEKLEVSNSKSEFPLSIILTTYSNHTFQKTMLSKLREKFNGILNMNGIKDLQETSLEGIQIKITSLQEILNNTESHIDTLSGYKDAEAPESVPSSCSVEIKTNLDVSLYAAEYFISASIDALGNSFTTAQLVNGNEAMGRLTNTLHDSYIQLTALSDKAAKIVTEFEALTSGMLLPSINAYVQQSVCVESAKFDHLKLLSCRKDKKGLWCDLSVEIYEDSSIYMSYTGINYNGVEIELPEDQTLVKSASGKYGLLHCRDEPDLIKDCIFRPWSHTTILFGDDPVKSLLESNFTLAPPPLPIQLHDTSVLVSNKDTVCKSKNGNIIKDLENKAPMAIKFGAGFSIITDTEQTKLEFKGGMQGTNVEFEFSVYNATSIDLMRFKALQNARDALDWQTILRYASIVFQVIVLPIAFTSCSLSVYALVRSIIGYRKKKQKDKINKKYDLRRNFEMNKRTAKKVRR